MWSNFVDSYFNIRTQVFAFVQQLVDMFQTKVDTLINEDIPLVDVIDLVVPEYLQQMTLLGAMTTVIVPVVLVLFIIRVVF